MPSLFRNLWYEPCAPGAQPPLRRDKVLVCVLVLLVILEGVTSPAVIWRPLNVLLTIGLVLTLPWRRTRPLAMVSLGFGATAVVQCVALLRGVDWIGLDTNAVLIILPYALLRWASGRGVVKGLVVIGVSFTTAALASTTISGPVEFIGAGLFLLFPAAIGLAVRYRELAQHRVIETARSRDREQLARELHDTVAHHVSAIAIQAQAGKALAATQPEAPFHSLDVIEEAASRTLAEMRHIVSALRNTAEVPLAPAGTLADIQRLADDGSSALRIEVNFAGRLDDLGATMQSTLYRLAQEAVTNAIRHSCKATCVTLLLKGHTTRVSLSVIDDGEAINTRWGKGFGLKGMTERVELLGGTLRVGPGDTQGWSVEAELPKAVAP